MARIERTEISRTVRFEAAHRLPNVPEGHKCRRLHGHGFRVTFVVDGPVDVDLGWIVDFGELERAWRSLYAQLDHRCLNEVEGLENPTAEHLARWIAERLQVPAPARLVRVTVHETCTSAATVVLAQDPSP